MKISTTHSISAVPVPARSFLVLFTSLPSDCTPLLVAAGEISSVQCGGVMGSHDNRDIGVVRRDSDKDAVGGDSRARSFCGGLVGMRFRGGIEGSV